MWSCLQTLTGKCLLLILLGRQTYCWPLSGVTSEVAQNLSKGINRTRATLLRICVLCIGHTYSKTNTRYWKYALARFVKICYTREPETVKALLKDLKWPSLEIRRKIARLTMFYKVINNLVNVRLPDDLLRKPSRFTPANPKPLVNLFSTSCTYICKYNFLTRSLKDWNLLPNKVFEASTLTESRQCS